MYRDGYKAALDELEKHKSVLAKNAAKLDEDTRDGLPPGLVEKLEALSARLTPTEETVEAVKRCEAAAAEYELMLTDALNVAAQIRGAKARGERLRFNRDGVPVFSSPLGMWAKRILAVATVGVAFTYAPDWMIERADEGSRECFAAIEEGTESDADSCRERALLLWPLAVPWKHERALAEWKSTARRADIVGLETSSDPDDVASLLASDPDDNAYAVAQQGFFEELAASDARDINALRAAGIVADFDAIKRHALALADVERPVMTTDVVRGAWLCLLGDEKNGAAALIRGDHLADRVVNTDGAGWVESRLALVACGVPKEQLGRSPYRVNGYGREAMTLLRLSDPTWHEGRRIALLLGQRAALDGQSTASAAVALAAADDMSWTEALAWVVPDSVQGPLGAPTRNEPWAIHSPRDQHDDGRVAPLVFMKAAKHLGRIADTAPEIGGEEPPRYTKYRAHANAYAKPRAVLRGGVVDLFWHAAQGFARWGRRDEALAALAELEKVVPDAAALWWTAPTHLAVRDYEGALRKLDAAPELKAGAERYFHFLNRAYALAGLSRFDEAHAAAKTAEQSGSAGFGHADGGALAMQVAMALLSGKPVDVKAGPFELDSGFMFKPGVGRDWVEGWVALTGEPAERRAALRPRVPHQAFSRHTDAAPAAFIIAGFMVDDPKDNDQIERWLNRVFSSWHLKATNGAGLAAARAEAARWRGDQASAELWQKRADALFGLVKSHATDVLMDSLGD